ncbi:unnamed protein product [Protopolystoma xenopodis]|uniref:Uncharacterized protein n=1 Tax=Protopolystoma xenopodis TaxID=117903 RepID=A0A3S5A1C1_9PLAT|nr:unnamed protein product [Protopolystoma xenopodis]
MMKPFPVEIHRLGNTALHIAVECTLQPINSLFNVYPANNLPSAIHATDARVNSRITPLSENWLRQDSNICQERGQPVMKSSSLGDLIDDDSTDEKVSNEGETGLAITITRRRRLLSQSHLTIVEFILQNTPLNQIQQTNLRGDTVLHHAARHGCVEALKLILQAGGLPTPMLSFTNHNRQTALQLAEMMLSRLTSPSISDAKQRRVHHMKDSSPISQSSRGVHVPPSNRESFASDKNTLTLTYKGVNPFDESSPGVNDGFFSGSAANKDFEAELLDEMDRDVGTMLSVQGEEGEINGDADDYRACVGLLRLAECLMATSTSLVNPSHSSRGLSTSVATSSPNFFLGVTSLPLRADLLLSTFTHGSAVSSTSGVSSGSGLSLNPGISQQFRQALFEAVDRLDGVDWGLNTAPGTPFGINSIRGQKSIVPQVHNYVPATSSVINLGTAGITRQNETVMPASSMTSYKRSEASSNQIHATGVSDNTMRRRLLAKGNSVAIDWRESRRKFAEGLGIRTTRNKASDHAIQQHHHNQNQFSHHLQLLQQQMANKTENSLGKQVSPLSLCDSSTSNHASPAFSSGLITLPRKKGPAPRPPKASPNTGNGTFQAPSDKHSPGHTSLDADSSGLGFDERSSSAGPISRLFSSQRISRRSDLGLGIGVDLDFKLGFDFSFSNSLSDSQNNNEREASSLASCPPHFRTLVSPNRHGTQLSNYLVRALTSSHHSKSNVSGVDDVGRADECANSGDRTKFLDHFRFSTLIQTTNNTIKDDLQLMDPCSSM